MAITSGKLLLMNPTTTEGEKIKDYIMLKPETEFCLAQNNRGECLATIVILPTLISRTLN